MNYKDWEDSVSKAITADSLWKMTAYRLALFIGDISWPDVSKLIQDRRTVGIAGQLYEAVGSISANLAEGYSRGTSKDRARFYEYALGSARESRDWYFKGRYILGETVTEHRLNLLAEIIRLLLTMIPQQRQRTLREENISYGADTNNPLTIPSFDAQNLENLLQTIPFNNP